MKGSRSYLIIYVNTCILFILCILIIRKKEYPTAMSPDFSQPPEQTSTPLADVQFISLNQNLSSYTLIDNFGLI